MVNSNAQFPLYKLILIFVYVLIWPAALLLLAGDWRWIEGWVFGLWFVVMCIATILYLYRYDAALLNERLKKPGTGNQKGWDKYVIYAIGLGFMAWLLIMPLDARRFGWTTGFPVWLEVIGGIALIPSFFFFYRSYTDNTFLSPLVRVQHERKQQVITTGVYGFVRHPMYLGAILHFIGVPLLLGSRYGLLIGLLLSLLLIGRIVGEENMLVNELEGYGDYRHKVRYRLIPFVW